MEILKIRNEKAKELLHYDMALKYFRDMKNVLEVTSKEKGKRKIDFEIVDKCLKDLKEIETSKPKSEGKVSEFCYPNIYGILTRKSKKDEWTLKYVGQRKSKSIRTRLKNHLINKSEKTGSQLAKVNHELSIGNEIAIKLFTVFPDTLRQFYEQNLINDITTLEWNKHK